MRRRRKTKILATLGPASNTKPMMKALFDAGVDVFRINMSHTSHDMLGQMVADLRKVMKLNRHHSLLKTGRIEESLAEHAAIMQAIEQRDPVSAAVRMREHFQNGLEAAA